MWRHISSSTAFVRTVIGGCRGMGSRWLSLRLLVRLRRGWLRLRPLLRLRSGWLRLRPLLRLRELGLRLAALLWLRELGLRLRPLLWLRKFWAESRRLLRGICRRPHGPGLRAWLPIVTRMRFERGAVSGLCRARAARSGGSRDRCTTCPDNVRRSEGGRPRSGGDRGAALIDPCLQLGILARLVDVPHLHHGRRNIPLARRQLVSIARRRRDASGAAVVAHLVDGDVVDYRLVVLVVDNRRVDIVDRRVGPEL